MRFALAQVNRPARNRAAHAFAWAALLAIGVAPALAADPAAGRAKAMACQACHGLDGLSKVPDAPNIAGQNEAYLVAQLQAFKTGRRQNESMSVVAAALSDSDIAALAAYYAAIEIRIGKIPGG